MDINLIFVYFIFGLIAFVLLLNIFKLFFNVLKKKAPTEVIEEYPEIDPFIEEVRSEIETKIRPHMNSLEGIYHKSGSEEKALSDFIFSVSQEKLSSVIEKDEALVHKEIENYCSAYENAECKESFCLEGSGISCGKL
jgi:hypothetical protein